MLPYRRRRDGDVTPYRRQGGMELLLPSGGEGMGMLNATCGRVGWDRFALPARNVTPYRRRRDGNVTRLWRQGRMGSPRPTSGGGMEMLRTTGGRVAAEWWKGFALPAAGWDGNVTPYRRRRDGYFTPYRRQGGMELLRASGGEGMGMLRASGGRVGWDRYALPTRNVTPYRWRRDGNVTRYRRQGRMGSPRPTGG